MKATHEVQRTDGSWTPAIRLADGALAVLYPDRVGVILRAVARTLKVRRVKGGAR